MAREETRQYWEEQLSEYWGAGFSISEYCELKDLPRESTRRWIRIFEKERVPRSMPLKKRTTLYSVNA